ncbi:hypothetical protein MYRNA_100 [Mycobacterium phage Myrna]|uniref:Uncharacterized protein n=1 Tax=Mycobacterium phage Myrna TaxID=546805 RepID=B5LJA4_9CAUD|nr:gp100 [Mycobacterium phage Myrna]ACH62101.1 hypothetical protein MYRNA_100 [Mycobacterium phage Myrna]
MTTKTDSQIRQAIAEGRIVPAQARVIRALIETVPVANFDTAVLAGCWLHTDNISPHQIRTNYRAGGLTYDYVNEVIDKATAS